MNLITIKNNENETEFLAGATISKIISDTTSMIGEASRTAITYAAEIASKHSAELIARRASELISLERPEDAAKLVVQTQDLIQADHRAMLITLKKTAQARIPDFTDATIEEGAEVKSLKDQLAKMKEDHNAEYEKHASKVKGLEQDIQTEKNAYDALKADPETVELQRQVSKLQNQVKDGEDVEKDLDIAREQLTAAQKTISDKQAEIDSKVKIAENAKSEAAESKSRYDENRKDFIRSSAEESEKVASSRAAASAAARREYPLSRFLAEHDMSVAEGERAANAINAPMVDKDIQRIGEIVYYGTDDKSTVIAIRAIVKTVIDSLEYKATAERYKDLKNDWNTQVQRMAEQATS